MMEKMIKYFKGRNGQLQIYNDKIVITRKGFNTFALNGAGEKDYQSSK